VGKIISRKSERKEGSGKDRLFCMIWDSHSGGYGYMRYNAEACHLLSVSSAYSTLKMEVICSPETSDDFQRTARCYIPEDYSILLFILCPYIFSQGRRGLYLI
jgi:hypothetical protein